MLVTVCGLLPVLVQVTVPPIPTKAGVGLNELSAIVTDAAEGCPAETTTDPDMLWCTQW